MLDEVISLSWLHLFQNLEEIQFQKTPSIDLLPSMKLVKHITQIEFIEEVTVKAKYALLGFVETGVKVIIQKTELLTPV